MSGWDLQVPQRQSHRLFHARHINPRTLGLNLLDLGVVLDQRGVGDVPILYETMVEEASGGGGDPAGSL